MKQTALLGAFALSTLIAGAWLPAKAQQAQIGARPGTQPGVQTGAQMSTAAGAPTPQQAQKAQQSRSEAEAYLQQQESATDNRPTQNTDRASGAVGGTGSGATAVTGDRGPAYGPVLNPRVNPRQPAVSDPAHRNPAEVHDEADPGANPAAGSRPPQQQRTSPQAARRPAWQNAADPMAPRPLRRDRALAADPEPLPAPAAAPQPVTPTSIAAAGCIGATCSDPAGGRINGVGSNGGAGVNGAGRLCNRSGATVQCF